VPREVVGHVQDDLSRVRRRISAWAGWLALRRTLLMTLRTIGMAPLLLTSSRLREPLATFNAVPHWTHLYRLSLSGAEYVKSSP
jgi:hypothetical protein